MIDRIGSVMPRELAERLSARGHPRGEELGCGSNGDLRDGAG